MRFTKDDYFMILANTTAKRSTCKRLQVGAVLVNQNYNIISTGYNGAARRLEHCVDYGCAMEGNHCVRAVHAESNVIAQAAAHGIATENSILYVTHKPCTRCVNLLINAGVREIVWQHEYGTQHNPFIQSSVIAFRQFPEYHETVAS